MKSRLIRYTLAVAVCIYLPLQSMAWGPTGHRVVGEIASSYLTSKAAKEVQKILGNETMALASTWADFIRNDSNYNYLTAWHYVDVDKGTPSANLAIAMQKDTGANAYNRITFLVTQLKNKSLSQADKLLYLRLLIHLVGDVHQPLHVSEHGDRGGNEIKVTWLGKPSNLHRVWDEDLILFQELSYTEYTKAINFCTEEQRKQWQKTPVADWLNESYGLNLKLHEEVKDGAKLSYAYNFEHIKTVNERLLMAGVRLAGLLNEIFG